MASKLRVAVVQMDVKVPGAIELSKRLGCYVVAGYPEKLLPIQTKITVSEGGASLVEASEPTPESAVEVQLAGNSAVLFGPEGRLVGTYRKTNLYEADLPWAQAGTGFTTFELPPPLKKLAIGICMDLNPNPASYETLVNGNASDVVKEPYELAEFCIEQGVDTLVIPCAWLDSGEGTDWDIGTVNYWCHRLQPLWSSNDEEDGELTGGRKTTVIICNRAGFERGTQFAGTSTVMQLERGSGNPNLVGVLKRKDDGGQIFTIDL
ncbi:Carbon-nitrogen hydrolase [Tulasnella sp. UAMH 9824]|nr:Carbon-nitrogen hydrolase [Tulasnella sp. UAMH 9824]